MHEVLENGKCVLESPWNVLEFFVQKRVRTVLWKIQPIRGPLVLEKDLKMPSNFPDLEKVVKMETKSEKMVKRQVFFKATCKWNIFRFGQIFFNLVHTLTAHHEKKLCSCILKSMLITYLITLSLEKEIIVLEKVSKKSCYRSKNLYEPWELDTMCQQHVWYVKINICSSMFKNASCWLACASPSDSRDVTESRSSENWVCMIWETDQIWHLFSFKNGPSMVTL